MDWADDITYAVHDVEDFYKADLIPLDRLRYTDVSKEGHPPEYKAVNETETSNFLVYAIHRLSSRNLSAPPVLRSLFAEYATYFPENPYQGRRLQDGIIDSFASKVITACSKATSVTPSGGLSVTTQIRSVIEVLKQLTIHYVIEQPDLVSHQAGQVTKMQAVFEHFLARAKHALEIDEADPLTGSRVPLPPLERWRRRRTLPVRLDELIGEVDESANGPRADTPESTDRIIARSVVDFVASMTEREIEEYSAIVGMTERITCRSEAGRQ